MYGGTKTEMQRLLTDATKFSGVKYDMSNLGDVYSAVHVIQEEMGITGTTALEAEKTLSGSLNSMKGAFTNVLGKLALGEDIKPSLNALATTMKTFFVDNLLPAVGNVLLALPSALMTFATAISPQMRKVGTELLGKIFGAETTSIITTVLSGVKDLIKNGFDNLIIVFKVLKDNANILIPVLAGLLAGIVAFKVMTSISKAITVMQGAMILLKGSTIGQAIAQGTLNTVMLANPIALVALAIGVLVGAGILLWKNWDTIKEKAGQLWGFLGNVFSAGKELLKTVVSNMWKDIQRVFTFSVNLVKSVVSNFWNGLKLIFTTVTSAIKFVISSFWSGLVLIFTTVTNVIKLVVSNFWNGLKLVFTVTMNFIKASVSFWINGIKLIITTVMNVIKNVFSSVWNGIKLVIITVINVIKSTVTSIFSSIRDFLSNTMNTIKSTMSNAWNSVRTTTSNLWESIKSTVVNKANDLVNNIKSLPGRMADGIKAGKSKLVSAFKGMFNEAMQVVGKPVNGIIGGANWVLERLGAPKLDPWPIPKYAKGTGGHPGGTAMVNDAPGSTYKELVTLPNGNRFIPEGRNVIIPDMPKGTKVIPALETEKMFKYAKGTKGAKKEVNDGIDIMSLFSAPKKLAEMAISKFVDFKNMAQYPMMVGKGIVSKVKDSLGSFLASQFHTGEGGEYGGLGGFAGLKMTSPYGMRRHPISGKTKMHTGVDFGGGQRFGHPITAQANGVVDFSGAMGGYGNVVRTKAGAFQHMYAHLQQRLANVGQNITKGQLIGKMGSTGNSTGPHVHYEVRQNGKHVNPMNSITANGSNAGAGSGVERWRGTVIKALGMNGLPTNSNYVNAWLRQIKTESGGNATAVQGKIGDVNNRSGDLAKGLVQVIGSTFNRYKFPGHNNRFSGLDSLLAGMNYAKNRYGSKMLSRIGTGKGYERGGIINTPQLANIGERGKKEMIVPLTNKARAMQLIQKSLQIMGVDTDNVKGIKRITQTPEQEQREIKIIIQNMTVREEADIERIAAELYRKQKREQKAGGII